MDESHACWIRDAREGALPVAVTGVVLFTAELGIPFVAVCVLLALVMSIVLIACAWESFGSA